MPITYYKQDDDKQFRVVNITQTNVGKFQKFDTEKIDYPASCVIEVEKEDGTTRIEYGQTRQVVNVVIYGDCLHIPAHIPIARLWVRDRENPGMHYKVPELKKDGTIALMLILGGPKNVELVGDQYFEAIYELHQA